MRPGEGGVHLAVRQGCRLHRGAHMQQDIVVDFLLPLYVIGGGMFVFMALADVAYRAWAWLRGEKPETFIEWF